MVETFWTPPLILKGLPAAELPNCERQANGIVLVWGQGFSQSGGNTLLFQRSGYQDVAFTEGDGLYYWDLDPGQINASLGGLLVPGPWTLTVQSACSSTPSNSLSVAIE